MPLKGPRQHKKAFECIGHAEMALPEYTPAHQDVRMRCSKRHACLSTRQHTKGFECITISCVREHDGVPPGCRPTVEFSRRKRAGRDCQKANDLVRAAVGWNVLFGAPVAAAWVVDRLGRPYHPGTT